jgi:hypothetical protein
VSDDLKDDLNEYTLLGSVQDSKQAGQQTLLDDRKNSDKGRTELLIEPNVWLII